MIEIDGTIWLVMPMIGLLVLAVIGKGRPRVLKPNRKNTAVGIVIAVTILAAYYFLRYVTFPE